MDIFIKRRYITALGFLGIIFISFFMMGKANKFNLFPPEQTEIYIARYTLPIGTPLEKTRLAGEKISKAISNKLGDRIDHIISRAGESKVQISDPKAIDGSNVGIVFIYVNDDTKNNVAHTTFLDALREIRPDDLKSLTFEAQINGPPVGAAIEGTFRSNNMQSLDLFLTKIQGDLEKIDGILNINVNDVIGDDEVYVNIDYSKADKLGLNVNTIGNTIRSAISGKNISTVTLNNKEVDLRIRLEAQSRENIEDLSKVQVMDRKGNLLPLESFATFVTKTGSPQIKRFDFKRSKTLTASINDKIMTSIKANQIVKELYLKYSKEIPGISLVFGGAAESTKESMQSLAQAGILALIGIFAILVFLFKSYLRPIIVMFTIPLGLLGLSVAFYTPILSGFPDRSREISFMALIGIIGLAGIIVNSGIVLISFIDQMREEGKLSLHQILVKASGMRLRAVLVTSLTTISGLLPTAYGIGGSDSMLVPMTMAMAWGLTSGTILTLIFIPCAYAILEDFITLIDKTLLRFKKDSSGSIINK